MPIWEKDHTKVFYGGLAEDDLIAQQSMSHYLTNIWTVKFGIREAYILHKCGPINGTVYFISFFLVTHAAASQTQAVHHCRKPLSQHFTSVLHHKKSKYTTQKGALEQVYRHIGRICRIHNDDKVDNVNTCNINRSTFTVEIMSFSVFCLW